MKLKEKLSIPVAAKVILVEKNSLVLRVVNNTDEINGKLLETDSIETKAKVDDVLNFNVDGEYVSTEPRPKPVKEKKVTERKGHTGSSKQRQNY